MVDCDYCGKKIQGFPFKCRYCGGTFCQDHHLPEEHDCARINEVTPPYAKTRQPTSSLEENKEVTKKPGLPIFPLRKQKQPRQGLRRGFKFTKKEILHLSAATVLTSLVAFSLYGWQFQNLFHSIFLIGVIAPSFLFHELAHKFTAQHFGIWAEFRLMMFGVLLTLVSIIPISPIKFLAPGAVMINSPTSREKGGKISIAGPLVNVSFGVIFLLLYLLPFLPNIFRIGVYLNGLIAVFNLLPFGPLDGKKVLRWDKVYWGTTLAIAGFLTAYGLLF